MGAVSCAAMYVLVCVFVDAYVRARLCVDVVVGVVHLHIRSILMWLACVLAYVYPWLCLCMCA